MSAGPPKNNKNAEKYTRVKAAKLFSESIKLSLQMEEGAYKYDFIGEVARDLGTYHHVYAHLVTRFPTLKKSFTELKSNLEANCYFNSKKGFIREATGIVNLKSNHKWTDRNDQTSGDEPLKPPSNIIVQDKETGELLKKMMNEDH